MIWISVTNLWDTIKNYKTDVSNKVLLKYVVHFSQASTGPLISSICILLSSMLESKLEYLYIRWNYSTPMSPCTYYHRSERPFISAPLRGRVQFSTIMGYVWRDIWQQGQNQHPSSPAIDVRVTREQRTSQKIWARFALFNSLKPNDAYRGYPAKRALSAMRKHGG